MNQIHKVERVYVDVFTLVITEVQRAITQRLENRFAHIVQAAISIARLKKINLVQQNL